MKIKNLVSKLRIKPQKSLGQNFLDSSVCQKIVDSWSFKNENILEIGPGLGSLTDFFIDNKNLILVEKDFKIYNFLIKKYRNENIQIFNLDILNFDLKTFLSGKKWKVVGNLPFSSAKKILDFFLKNKTFFSDFYFSFSSEFAEKILNQKKCNYWGFYAQSNAQIRKMTFVRKTDFFPSPKVDVLFLHFKLNNKENLFLDSEFSSFLKGCLLNKRKKFINNSFIKDALKEKEVKDQMILNKLSLDNRAEELPLSFFLKLFKLKKFPKK